jgi:hypothetical protein
LVDFFEKLKSGLLKRELLLTLLAKQRIGFFD